MDNEGESDDGFEDSDVEEVSALISHAPFLET